MTKRKLTTYLLVFFSLASNAKSEIKEVGPCDIPKIVHRAILEALGYQLERKCSSHAAFEA